jgi:hypothetical protein
MNGVKKLGLVGTLLGGAALTLQSMFPVPAFAKESPKEKGSYTLTIPTNIRSMKPVVIDFETGNRKTLSKSFLELKRLKPSEREQIERSWKEENYDALIANGVFYMNREIDFKSNREVKTGETQPKIVHKNGRIYQEGTEELMLQLQDKNEFVYTDKNGRWIKKDTKIRKTKEGNFYEVTTKLSPQRELTIEYRRLNALPENAK